jgi:acylaminoacyl-peptidase
LFSAAVADRSVVNLYSFYGTSDDYRLIEEDVQQSFPWDRPEHYLAKSPINYTKNVRTPLLIMHAEDDFRCRLEQAEQLYAFLKRQGKEVVLAIFPEESHGLSRSGKPHHRIERLELMKWWFGSHIRTGENLIVEKEPPL